MHNSHDGSDPNCGICRCVIEVNRNFALMEGRIPRYRYWRVRRSKGKSERTFEYTTETAGGGKYWAIERRWVRVKGGERGKVVRKVGFRTRTKAKERAYAWFRRASTSANPAPV